MNFGYTPEAGRRGNEKKRRPINLDAYNGIPALLKAHGPQSRYKLTMPFGSTSASVVRAFDRLRKEGRIVLLNANKQGAIYGLPEHVVKREAKVREVKGEFAVAGRIEIGRGLGRWGGRV